MNVLCGLFGHSWIHPDLPSVYPVTWCAGGAQDFLVCRRCGVHYADLDPSASRWRGSTELRAEGQSTKEPSNDSGSSLASEPKLDGSGR